MQVYFEDGTFTCGPRFLSASQAEDPQVNNLHYNRRVSSDGDSVIHC
jgi:hypothetical protein